MAETVQPNMALTSFRDPSLTTVSSSHSGLFFFLVLGRSPPASGALPMLLPLSSTLFSFLIPHHRNTPPFSGPRDHLWALILSSQTTQSISFMTFITTLVIFQLASLIGICYPNLAVNYMKEGTVSIGHHCCPY